MSNVDFVGTFSEPTSTAVVPISVLAPMSGVTDLGFRRLASRFGADFVVTEMVAASAYVAGAEEARLRAEGIGVSPHIVQLVGRNPDRMADAARLAEASGADVIDINMGCPAKHVIGGLAGSALMREPKLAVSIISAVVVAVSVPVTVKMRLGWDHASLNAPEIIRAADAAGVSAFVVHGRTRQQFYKGEADWAAIRASVTATTKPVLANGDIVDLASAQASLARSGGAGVMIGRAALGQPWIVREIGAGLRGERWEAPSPAERSQAAQEHYEDLLSRLGIEIGVRHARKHLAAYSNVARRAGYGLDAAEHAEMLTTTEPRRVIRSLSRLYAEPMRRAA